MTHLELLLQPGTHIRGYSADIQYISGTVYVFMQCIRDACNDLLTLGWKAIAVTKSMCWKQQRHSFLEMCHNLHETGHTLSLKECWTGQRSYWGCLVKKWWWSMRLTSNHNLKFYLLFEVWNWKLPIGNSDKRIYMYMHRQCIILGICTATGSVLRKSAVSTTGPYLGKRLCEVVCIEEPSKESTWSPIHVHVHVQCMYMYFIPTLFVQFMYTHTIQW